MQRACVILETLLTVCLLSCAEESNNDHDASGVEGEQKRDASGVSVEEQDGSPTAEATILPGRDAAVAIDTSVANTDARIIDRCPPDTEILRATIRRMEKIDLLFVVDNSQSMEAEQQKLREQFPMMIEALTTGDSDGDGETDFPPASDLHLAVISTDLGLPGLAPEDIPDTTGACKGIGDDGVFINGSANAIDVGLNCSETDSNPPFISAIEGVDQPESVANDFSCYSWLGLGGCGFEMQLEAALKALWPSSPDNLNERQRELALSFLSGTPGHGDTLHKEFLRGTPYHPTESEDLSLLAIIVVTDEEDCSAGAQGNLDFLSLNFPAGDRRDLNLRCYKDGLNQWGNRYSIERYLEAFRALRPEHEQLLVFAGIVGTPVDVQEDENGDGLVTPSEHLSYFDRLLAHPLMQETVDPDRNNLKVSCTNVDSDGTITTEAYPPRRLVEVAQQFGQKGIIHSICRDDFRPAIEDIVDAIAYELGSLCIKHEITRDENGLIECDVVWEMPLGLDCDQPYLTAHAKQPRSENGRNNCVVNQLAVDAERLEVEEGQGWYWDDFSEELEYECKEEGAFRVAFSLPDGLSRPPIGTTSVLECPDECVIIE